MHGGLHVEMASFFVSRIVAGLRVTAKMRQAFPLQFLFWLSSSGFRAMG